MLHNEEKIREINELLATADDRDLATILGYIKSILRK